MRAGGSSPVNRDAARARVREGSLFPLIGLGAEKSELKRHSHFDRCATTNNDAAFCFFSAASEHGSLVLGEFLLLSSRAKERSRPPAVDTAATASCNWNLLLFFRSLSFVSRLVVVISVHEITTTTRPTASIGVGARAGQESGRPAGLLSSIAVAGHSNLLISSNCNSGSARLLCKFIDRSVSPSDQCSLDRVPSLFIWH